MKNSNLIFRTLANHELSLDNVGGEQSYPFVIEAKEKPPLEIINGINIRDLAHTNGAVLFRNFGINTVDQFDKFIASSGLTPEDKYLLGSAPRIRHSKYIFSSTECSPKGFVLPHTEMSYLPIRPTYIMFQCERASPVFGETSLFNFSNLINEILSEKGPLKEFFADGECEVRRVYESNFPFQFTSLVETKTEKIALFKSLGISDVEFSGSGDITTTCILPHTIIHPQTAKICFANSFEYISESILNCFLHIFKDSGRLSEISMNDLISTMHGSDSKTQISMRYNKSKSGSQISEEHLKILVSLLWKHSVLFKWEEGDVLVIDNRICGHGRMNFSGTRKINVALFDYYDVRNMRRPPKKA
jgi:hypothetical protein